MPTRRKAKSPSTDALAILKTDHDKVKKLFKEFERLHDEESAEAAAEIATQICQELTIHATIEEEIFYPEVRAALDDADLLDEAEVEHATVKDLVAQIEGMATSDQKYGAKVRVLGEYVNHHVKEEQDEMFPKARKAGLNLSELGARMMARKQDLKAEMGLANRDEKDPNVATSGAETTPPERYSEIL